ncbi:MAG: type IV-A pilus assembly ATPase PilB [Bdellovibrionaceae bacterium]|nr:type IV-A pilus assembly ATPase PilB [Pseudobdellovibrionaceae bacterium]
MSKKKAIDELLVRKNLVGIDQLEDARELQKEKGGNLTSALISLGHVTEKDLSEFLGEEYGLPTVDLSTFECDPEALKTLDGKTCIKYKVIPVSKAGKTLVVAFTDPSNIFIKDDVALLSRCKIEIVVASEQGILSAIEKYYGKSADGRPSFENMISEIEDEDFDSSIMSAGAEEIGEVGKEESPIISLVNAVLMDAIKLKASDIHIEPYEKRFRIRFRVDGKLTEKMQPPLSSAGAITARVKIISKMDIAERRRPQDGRLKVKLSNGKEVDFRVSCLPTLFGEKIVLRLLDKSNLQADLRDLGLEEEQFNTINEAIHQPQGMVLITGPTGSGKTTTVYSCLAELNAPDVNLSTAEDPVEFNLDGINQVQVQAEIGFNFADALKSFLRQDPEIIMVGEIRDLETASVAYKAASTGHLVVSTLHTNDATATISRLLDMGVPDFLVAEATSLVVAQRLLKKNCQHCLVDVKILDKTLLSIGVLPEEIAEYQNLKKGEGCARCNGGGQSGRMAVYEVLRLNAEIKSAIFEKVSPLELRRIAILSGGMQSLRRSALLKLKRGEVSMEEIINVTVGDDL